MTCYFKNRDIIAWNLFHKDRGRFYVVTRRFYILIRKPHVECGSKKIWFKNGCVMHNESTELCNEFVQSSA